MEMGAEVVVEVGWVLGGGGVGGGCDSGRGGVCGGGGGGRGRVLVEVCNSDIV